MTKSKKVGKPQIVVLQRGWVVLGLVRREGQEVVIEKASVVRRWGTTNGLGQLASDGPQPNTVLDPTPTVRTHELGVVFSVDMEISKWPSLKG